MFTLLGRLDEELGATAREHYAHAWEDGLSVALLAGSPADAWFFVETGRAGALLEALSGRDAIAASAIPQELRTIEADARGEEVAAAAALRSAQVSGDRTAIAQTRRRYEEARGKTKAAVERIQRESAAAADLLFPGVTADDRVRSGLGPGEALVLYAFFDEAATALVLTRDGLRIVPLAAANEIRAACEALALEDPKASSYAPVRALAALVVEPLQLAEGSRRVLVSPDGPLSFVPFTLLFPGREIAYVPSGTTYALLGNLVGPAATGVLAIGDPDVTAGGNESAVAFHRGPGARLLRLPASADEAKAVGDTVLVGAAATEEGVRRALATRSRWRSVHLACHGLVDSERPALCALALTPTAEDDGFLTGLDVFRLKLPADLAVLSACETGKGRVVHGEGVMGLTRAFMFAGAPRVICSLWKVDDRATLALMKKFYELWNPKDGSKGLGTAAALKGAQDFVRSREEWKHPYYWAAWVLWGLAD
jgi:CHAT domain-containing protein